MNSDGKAIEHWDVLQEVGDPKKAVHANGMF
jgi:predicted SnoaL-like aldol condensation-catalyzing enzyme